MNEKALTSTFICEFASTTNRAAQCCSQISIYIKLKVCLSVCLSAIEIKLETFRYKQTYESYITFSREAKYGILISIRIVYGGLRVYIYLTYMVIQCKNSITNHKQNVRKVYI